MEIKTTKRDKYTPKMAKIEKLKQQMLARLWSNWNFHNKWCDHLGESSGSFL